MKFTTALLAVFFAAITIVTAQVPQGFTYQSVLRDASGIPVANEAGISVQFTIIIGGSTAYSETVITSTNQFGLITETVGLVSPASFAAINWSSGSSYQLKADVTFSGGTISKTNDLYTVPFAMVAANPGLPGPTGPAGTNGTNGTNGAQGPTGPAGTDGTNGTNGTNGVDGADGADGLLPNGTDPGNLTYWDGSTWRVDATGYDYNGAEIGLNDNQLRVRGAGDGNHFLQYDGFDDGSGALDGPELVGLSSVRLRQISGSSVGYLTLRNNRVGINTANPTRGLLEVNGFYNHNQGNFTYYAGNGGLNAGGASGTVDCSIFATNRMMATEFDAFSDARIKKIEGISNGFEDLQTLMQIEITNYSKIDRAINKGTEKKVIAQQVELIYPQVVSKSTNVIPNIYKVAELQDGRIEVPNELKSGDKVRLILQDREELTEVLTADANGFTVSLADAGEVFVFGSQVDDFRSVDYQAISMLNVSATQELFRMITAQQEVIEAMNSQMGDLRSQLELNNDLIIEMKGILGISSTSTPEK